MKATTSLLYLTPRFLSTLMVLLIFAFVLELTAEQFNLETFFLSLIPGIVVLILLIIAWRKEGIGGWLFIILGIIGILYPFATTREFHFGYLILPGWAIIVGILFLMNKYK